LHRGRAYDLGSKSDRRRADASGETPVPVSVMICGESGASSLMLTEPGYEPFSVGLNPTVKEQVPLWGIW